MRTTLTIEDDVFAKLRQLAQRERRSFKEVVNAALRRGLSGQKRSGKGEAPHRVRTFRSAFRHGVDQLRLNQLVDELEARRATETP